MGNDDRKLAITQIAWNVDQTGWISDLVAQQRTNVQRPSLKLQRRGGMKRRSETRQSQRQHLRKNHLFLPRHFHPIRRLQILSPIKQSYLHFRPRSFPPTPPHSHNMGHRQVHRRTYFWDLPCSLFSQAINFRSLGSPWLPTSILLQSLRITVSRCQTTTTRSQSITRMRMFNQPVIPR